MSRRNFAQGMFIAFLGIGWYGLYAAPLGSTAKKVKANLTRKAQALKHELEVHGHPNPAVQEPKPVAGPPPVLPHPQTLPTETRSERFIRGVANVMTKPWRRNLFVWLPAVTTDPNAGLTVGFMPVLLVPESDAHRIRHLLAPAYTYNPHFGQTLTGNYFLYPTESSQWFTELSISQHTNRDFETRYENDALAGKWLAVTVEGGYIADGSRRFFGVGPQTREGDEAGYTSKYSFGRMAAGVNFLSAWRLSAGVRYKRIEVGPTIIHGVTDLQQRYAAAPGAAGSRTITQEIRLLWDTRDLPATPSKGSSGELTVETTDRGWGSDSDFVRYRLEGKQFFPWTESDQVTVLRGRLEKVNGPTIPFEELATLGGRQNFRGYGDGRFSDRGALVANLEHRIPLASLSLMDMETRIEAAPFLDIGTVFPNLNGIERRYVRTVEGIGFRAVFKPNVVGDVEVGFGNEGPAVFVDLDYPF